MLNVFFGILKQQFACLSGTLRLSPEYAGEIFKTCCILQNLIVDDFSDDNDYFSPNGDDDLNTMNDVSSLQANVMRDRDPRVKLMSLLR